VLPTLCEYPRLCGFVSLGRRPFASLPFADFLCCSE
jgi:hypothetical protein